jgi:hypothetical protein
MAINTVKTSSAFVGIAEAVTDYTFSSNVGTINLNNGNIPYFGTAPTANFTINVTNVPTNNGQAVTLTIFITQGATGYIPTTFQIDGTGQTIKWANGAAPTPTSSAGKIDVFSFTLVRRSSAWTVFASSINNF